MPKKEAKKKQKEANLSISPGKQKARKPLILLGFWALSISLRTSKNAEDGTLFRLKNPYFMRGCVVRPSKKKQKRSKQENKEAKN